MPRPVSGEEGPPAGGMRRGRGTDNEGGLAETLQLGALLGLWYLFNICFSIHNKQVLKVFPFPANITTLQFAVGTAISLLMWITGILRRPKISGAQLAAILPLAMVHTMGNIFTNMSLGKVAVSFTHTPNAKATMPFFLVLMSAIFLDGEMGMQLPIVWVVLSLSLIAGGVALTSLTDAPFNWAWFRSVMSSNVTFQSRNVPSKKLVVKKEESMGNINLFSIVTVKSFCLLAPVAFLTEGIKLRPTVLQSAGLDVQQVFTRSLIAAFCFHAYQQVLYMILARVSPVTDSVGGTCAKYIGVTVVSVVFSINYIGAGIALAGVLLCSQLKRLVPKA